MFFLQTVKIKPDHCFFSFIFLKILIPKTQNLIYKTEPKFNNPNKQHKNLPFNGCVRVKLVK